MANRAENLQNKQEHHPSTATQSQTTNVLHQKPTNPPRKNANKFWFSLALAFTAFAAPGQKCAIAQNSQPNAQTPAQSSDPQLPCDLKQREARTVVQVKDSTTLILEDGTRVRLSGILAPAPPPSPDAPNQPPTQPTHTRTLEKNAVDALTQLTVGQPVILAFVTPKRDRYTNLQAHVFVKIHKTDPSTTAHPPTKPLTWVQAHLLENGLAQAYEPPGQSHCFEKLLNMERSARKSNAGIWANPMFRPIPSDNTARIEKRIGSYTRVFGKIKSVARRRTLTYLNFGSHWRSDFTITIPRSVIRAHPNWAKNIETLENKSVNVQGWVTIKNGPMIELEHPEQLTVSEQ